MANKYLLCNILFWLKVLIALLAAWIGLGYQMVLIKQRREYALAHPNEWVPPNPPGYVDIPLPGSWNSSLCAFEPVFDQTLGRTLARLEPPGADNFWFGFDLQWQVDSPKQVIERLGHQPAIFNTFINMNRTQFEKDTIDWMAQQASEVGAMLEITVIPELDVAEIPVETFYAFAMEMRRVNSYYGVPVFLRFMHEMNGNWLTAYGQQPIKFRNAFATMAQYVHSLTNMTAMVWSPNIGTGYPYAGGSPAPPEEIASLLDTNQNGQLDNGDDPYMPYYPGDQYVDWVGISLYNLAYNDNDPNKHQTRPITPDFIPNQIRGFTHNDTVHDYYGRFSIGLNKPFMMSETASFYAVYNSTKPGVTPGVVNQNPDTAHADEIAIKKSWWESILFNAIGRNNDASHDSNLWRNFKMAIWFEEVKVEQSFWSLEEWTERDYHITYDKDGVTKAFLEDVTANVLKFPVAWAGRWECECTGHLKKNDEYKP